MEKYSKFLASDLCPINDNYKLCPCESPEARVTDKANYNPVLASEQTLLEGLKEFTLDFCVLLNSLTREKAQ